MTKTSLQMKVTAKGRVVDGRDAPRAPLAIDRLQVGMQIFDTDDKQKTEIVVCTIVKEELINW